MKSEIKTTELAELLGLTPRRLQQLSAEGVVTKTPRGRYHMPTAVHQYLRFLRAGAPVGDLKRELARKASADAALKELQLERERGRYVDAEDVKATWTAILLHVRRRLLEAPSKIESRLTPGAPPEAIRHLVDDEVREALTFLSDPNNIGKS